MYNMEEIQYVSGGTEQLTVDQKVAALKKAKNDQEHIKRRKRIQLYKNFIVVLICTFSLMPTLFSVYLLAQLTQMEQEVAMIAGKKQVAGSVQYSLTEEASGQQVDGSGEKGITGNTTAVEPGERVYLTFDDGPSENTADILDILEKNGVKATFFVTGHTDQESMQQYKAIVAHGHGIGIHSYTHDYSKMYSSLRAFQEDVNSMSDLIYAATGVRTHMYRFPGGSANTVSATDVNVFMNWLDSEGYIYYDWNALNGDAVTQNLAVSTLVQNVMTNVTKNREKKEDSIVLMHDMTVRDNTVESLQPLIDKLKAEGYQLDQPLTEEVAPVQQKVLEK